MTDKDRLDFLALLMVDSFRERPLNGRTNAMITERFEFHCRISPREAAFRTAIDIAAVDLGWEPKP